MGFRSTYVKIVMIVYLFGKQNSDGKPLNLFLWNPRVARILQK